MRHTYTHYNNAMSGVFFSCSPIQHNCMNVQDRSHTPSCYEETGSHFIPGTDRRAVTINTVETPDFNSNMQMLTLNSYLKIHSHRSDKKKSMERNHKDQ